ncbi:hypothetical protein H8959_013964 [Pygathrix nigripes]
MHREPGRAGAARKDPQRWRRHTAATARGATPPRPGRRPAGSRGQGAAACAAPRAPRRSPEPGFSGAGRAGDVTGGC